MISSPNLIGTGYDCKKQQNVLFLWDNGLFAITKNLNKLILQAMTSLNKSPAGEVDQPCDDQAQEKGEWRDEKEEIGHEV